MLRRGLGVGRLASRGAPLLPYPLLPPRISALGAGAGRALHCGPAMLRLLPPPRVAAISGARWASDGRGGRPDWIARKLDEIAEIEGRKPPAAPRRAPSKRPGPDGPPFDRRRSKPRSGPSPEQAALNDDMKHARTPDELLALFRSRRALYDLWRVGIVWNRLGRVSRGRLRGDSVQDLVEHTIGTLPSCNARAVANILHGAAKAGQARDAAALYEAGEAAALRVMREMDLQGISNTAWAFATAEQPAPALFDALAVQAVPMLGEMAPQDVSNTAWAFATAEQPALALSTRSPAGGADARRFHAAGARTRRGDSRRRSTRRRRS